MFLRNGHDPVSACGAALGAMGTTIAMLAEATMQLFGVPLQVVLASLTGALGARVFLPPGPFWRAAAAAVFWTITGALGAQSMLWLAGWALSTTPPAGSLAFGALLLAALGQRVAPILWESGGARLKRFIDGKGGGV